MKDFLGKTISAGDTVVCRIGSFKGLVTGKVIFTDHKAHIQLDVSNWMANRPLPIQRVVYAVSSVNLYKV